jgi:hypothetical protein
MIKSKDCKRLSKKMKSSKLLKFYPMVNTLEYDEIPKNEKDSSYESFYSPGKKKNGGYFDIIGEI